MICLSILSTENIDYNYNKKYIKLINKKEPTDNMFLKSKISIKITRFGKTFNEQFNNMSKFVRLANDYNREVFAIPGNNNQTKSFGANWLIENHQATILNNPE